MERIFFEEPFFEPLLWAKYYLSLLFWSFGNEFIELSLVTILLDSLNGWGGWGVLKNVIERRKIELNFNN